MPTATTPAPYALILINLAAEAGAQRDAILAGTSLAAGGMAAIGARIPDADFHQLARNALALTGDRALGLRLGERLNLSAHAVLGQAFMTCRELSEVIVLFQRYYHLLAPDLQLVFAEQGEDLIIDIESTSDFLPVEFGLECMAGAIRNTLGGLLGDYTTPLGFDFPYPAPAHAEQYRETLGVDVQFEQPSARWRLPLASLSRRLPSSNPALHALYEAECARLLADLEDSVDLAAQTRRLLRKLEGQYPQMPQIAAMLNVSDRTYRRRLAQEGTSFQELLDAARADHATRHLREGRLPVASIAYHLGFNDPSNFRRAYRRWTGVSPSQVRREARANQQ